MRAAVTDAARVGITLDEDQQRAALDFAGYVTGEYVSGRQRVMYWPAGGKEGLHAKNLNGYGGEVAVSAFTGLPWNRVRKGIDVGRNVQVRNTVHGRGHLEIQAYDEAVVIADGELLKVIYVLATGEFPVYTLAGWAPLDEIRAPAWRYEAGEVFKGTRLDKPRWFVPQSELKPMHELRVERP